MDTSVVTNADIQYRLEEIECCSSKATIKLSNKLKIGQPKVTDMYNTYFAKAFASLFENYYITEATTTTNFGNNPCVPIEDFEKIVDYINSNCSCQICLDPWGTYGESYDESYDDSFC